MRRTRKNNIGVIAGVFILAAAVVLIFMLIINKGSLAPAGKITYDESLSADEKSWLEELLADFRAPSDVTISASTESADALNGIKNYVVKDVLVPVTSFYDGTQGITSAEIGNYDLISVNTLTPEQKLLSLDGNYYLDDFTHGALYRIIRFNTDNSGDLANLISSSVSKAPSKENVLSLSQTGTTALARQMLKTLSVVGDGAYFAEYVKDFLSSSDLTHISNEVSFASDCAIRDMTLCADPRMYSALSAIGVDIVELTGNHNNDWGQSANIATIDLYHENGLKTFGGGKNEEDAATPLELSEKGNNITMIGINYSTSSKENGQGATTNSAGANIYDEKLTKKQITEAKEAGRFVIVDVQYAECYCYPDDGMEMPECDYPISGQQAFFRSLIDQGADMVIGTQAHQPQTFEIYSGKPIYYGLGNLFFDQIYWPGTERGLILTHYFKEGKLLQTRITPTMYGTTYQPAIMDVAQAEAFIKRLAEASASGK